jgi:energy-coupling factor transporter ATP-binding protein EcfA2
MILKSAHIKNFRSARDVRVSFERQTAIVGPNGAGKSTILKAIDRFYGSSSHVSLEDFFNRNVDAPIEIALTFIELVPEEIAIFGNRVNNGEMTVVRVFEAKGGKNSGKYFGLTRGHPAFSVIRLAENATAQRAAYTALRLSDPIYEVLGVIRRADEIEEQLTLWEAAHPDACDLIRDDGQFLGFTNVGNGSLKKSTSFVFIPAVRDAATDALDGKTSPIARLMELVVRSVIQKRQEIQDWQASASARYRELTNPANLTELGDLATALTSTLQNFYDETCVDLTWKPSADFEVPLPTALVSLSDAGYPAPVELQGNGLQRAFILTLLQHLATATILQDNDRASAPETSGERDESSTVEAGVLNALTAVIPAIPLIPGLILAIEEPELYQHPTKQRHFARVLSLLAEGILPGVATKTQVIFASHSPYFVCMDRFDQVRLARRAHHAETGRKECALLEAELSTVVASLALTYGDQTGAWTAESLKSKLHIVTPELAEGFFADAVLLVEGESDKAALRAAAVTKGIDLEAQGIAILQAGGKNNLDRPAAIFKTLGIPVYVVWDCDRKPNSIDDERANRALQVLCGVAANEVVGAASRLESNFACFEHNLEVMLRGEIDAAAYDAALTQAQADFGIRERKDAIKSSSVMKSVFGKLTPQGFRSVTLDGIIARVVAMRREHALALQSAATVDL